MGVERYRVEVNGIVQGVGFRPFVYKLAVNRKLNGTVCNTAGGVLIEVEGLIDALEAFVSGLKAEAPPLAVIESINIEKLECLGYTNFTISESLPGASLNTLVSPDISTCADCREELFNPADHRHLYPFINCTNCGPRFTIVCDVPYDRQSTTMSDFVMCPVCGAQYRDPLDRRYHAQPLCCGDCGPKVLLKDAEGRIVAGIGTADAGTDKRSADNSAGDNPITRAAELLAAGKILAVKSLGGYHLVCNALDSNVVAELRKRKYRDEKPFALMARDLETVQKYCETDESTVRLLQSAAAPIVLLPKKTCITRSEHPGFTQLNRSYGTLSNQFDVDLPDHSGIMLPEQLAPGNPYLGVMLPYTPLQLLLFFKSGMEPSCCPEMLVMTSGNRSDEPICFRDTDAFERLKGIADYFLTNNRPIRTRTDDSVVRAFRGKEFFIRRSRGYAPAPVSIDRSVLSGDSPSVLALGGELKNTFCLTKGNRFFMSPHIGDLENMETLQAFEDGIEHYKRLFDIRPTVAAFDLHPAYLSTAYAQTLKDMVKVPVQHHHAHIASCMAENGLSGEVIGVAFDGTGYGGDGNIWGGEFFAGEYRNFERVAHLEYFRLPGGEAAIKEPWRVAAALLWQYRYDMNLLKDIAGEKLKLISGMLDKSFNSPRTSSMGRLFDAVSALIGIKLVNRFEGQAAIELEHAAAGKTGRAYDFGVEHDGNSYIIGLRGMITEILGNITAGISPGMIAERFHGTVVGMVEDICCRIRDSKGLDRVVLSGGVFQNMLLLTACLDKLEMRGFKVFHHRRVPTNDGGISLGQAVIGMAHHGNI